MPIALPSAVQQIQPKPVSLARSTISGSIHCGQTLLQFSLQGLELAGSRRLRLVLRGLQKTAQSRVLRVSLACGLAVRLNAGNLYTYGEGVVQGPQQEERFFPLTLSLDITDAARQLTGAERVDVDLDILDPHGRMLMDEPLYLESVEIDSIDSLELFPACSP
ncbi:MAG: hypothetical protein PHE55_15190 [Methylococcaceae bacterium]|nr:hypothetical protein [Methylococcaceae bacterium]